MYDKYSKFQRSNFLSSYTAQTKKKKMEFVHEPLLKKHISIAWKCIMTLAKGPLPQSLKSNASILTSYQYVICPISI